MMYFSEKHAPRPSSFCALLKPIPESRHCVIAVLCKFMPCLLATITKISVDNIWLIKQNMMCDSCVRGE